MYIFLCDRALKLSNPETSLPPYIEVSPNEWKYGQEARRTGHPYCLVLKCLLPPFSPLDVVTGRLRWKKRLTQCAQIHSRSTPGLRPPHFVSLCVFTFGLNDGH